VSRPDADPAFAFGSAITRSAKPALEDFRMHGEHSPEHQALLRLIGTLVALAGVHGKRFAAAL
jgi:hypothetical protein